MQSRPGEGDPCPYCGGEMEGTCALPTFNGDVVSNDWPGEWFGRGCCEACYERHARGEIPVADKLYAHLFDGVTFSDGAGI